MNVNLNAKILITGATGGLGRALVKKLNEFGYSNLLTPARVDLNLLDKGCVLSYFNENKPDVVLHLASVVFGLQGNLDNQMKSALENTEINTNIFNAINENPVDYVFFAGTVASYSYPYCELPIQESSFFKGLPHDGEFGYAMAKKHAYTYLKILNEKKDISFTYGVFTNMYGEDDRFNKQSGHVIPSLIAKAFDASMNNTSFEVWGSGVAERDFLHFSDAAKAIIYCMERKVEDQLVNISSGQATTIKYVAELISNVAGISDLVFLSDKPVGIPSRVIDNTILLRSGFIKEISLEQGISKLYEWYKNNQGGIRE